MLSLPQLACWYLLVKPVAYMIHTVPASPWRQRIVNVSYRHDRYTTSQRVVDTTPYTPVSHCREWIAHGGSRSSGRGHKRTINQDS